jgi:hypothetical protein
MVAPFDHLIDSAYKGSDNASEQRNSVPAEIPVQASKAVLLSPASEANCELLLFLAQYVDGDWQPTWKIVYKCGVFVDTNEDERWIERNGRERTHGHAIRASVFHPASYNGHS